MRFCHISLGPQVCLLLFILHHLCRVLIVPAFLSLFFLKKSNIPIWSAVTVLFFASGINLMCAIGIQTIRYSENSGCKVKNFMEQTVCFVR